ncbi:MAG TPA: MoaD/ThiS family protein [Actinomycetota bacterium]|nr:MoaD/ThiS family protein [Actinomycetota bacterium]
MPVVVLRQPLRDMAEGNARVEVTGTTVGEALAALERIHPRTKGWVLDEHGDIRRHVNVFVDGERASAEHVLDGDAELNIIQAISGG